MKFLDLLILCLCIQRGDAFASYLLSQLNCEVELSTDEVIMNSQVVAAEESDDTKMQVKIIGDNPLPADTEYPFSLPLQVLTDNPRTSAGYQWVLEVNGTDAEFVSGSCENKRRIAGHSKEIVELTIKSPSSAEVWAGWATGHEQVRLTPKVTISTAANDDIPKDIPTTVDKDLPNNEESAWYAQLIDECSKSDWTSLETHAGQLIEHTEAELYVEMDETLDLPKIALSADVAFAHMVMHCSDGATLGEQCPHRVMVEAGAPWPSLTISEEQNIYVSALFSKKDQPGVLYRTKALELEWTPSSEDTAETEDTPVVEDVPDQPRKSAELLENHPLKNVLNKDPRMNRDSVLNRAKEEAQKVRQALLKQNAKKHEGHAEKVEKIKKEIASKKLGDSNILVEAVKQNLKVDDSGEARNKNAGKSQKEKAKPTKPVVTKEQPFAHAHPDQTSGDQEEEQRELVFNAGLSYYLGMAILVGGLFIGAQLCLTSSRKAKGRREL